MRSPAQDLLPDPLHPAARLAMLVGFVVAGGIVGALIGMPLAIKLTGLEVTSLGFIGDKAAFPPGWREFVEVTQIVIGVTAFGVAPLLMLRQTIPRRWLQAWLRVRFGAAPPAALLGAGAVGVVGYPLYGALVHGTVVLLPHLTEAIWATTKLTARAAAAVNRFDTPAHLLFSVVVLGGIAVVGQEITLRGVFQPTLSRWVGGRAGISIWLVALLCGLVNDANLVIAYTVFAAAVGYLYAWSGRLWIPIATSFTLNAAERVHLYVQQHTPPGASATSLAAFSWPAGVIAASALGTAGLLWWLRRYLLARAVPLDLPALSRAGRFASASDA